MFKDIHQFHLELRVKNDNEDYNEDNEDNDCALPLSGYSMPDTIP